jgi:hypothetical protein
MKYNGRDFAATWRQKRSSALLLPALAVVPVLSTLQLATVACESFAAFKGRHRELRVPPSDSRGSEVAPDDRVSLEEDEGKPAGAAKPCNEG